MPDDLDDRGAQDGARVLIGEEHEVTHWTGTFGVSREKRAEPVGIVGNGARAVGDFLGEDAQ